MTSVLASWDHLPFAKILFQFQLRNTCQQIYLEGFTGACLDAEGNALGTDGDRFLSNQFLMQYLRHQKL